VKAQREGDSKRESAGGLRPFFDPVLAVSLTLHFPENISSTRRKYNPYLVLCFNKVNPVRSLLLPLCDMLTGIGVSFLYTVFHL
jgi:hypothetical protein